MGRGYRTVEGETMSNNVLKGYGQVLLERGERKGRRKGRLEGRLEGERRGRLEGKLEVARNLKSFGSTTDQIARVTGLPDDVIAKL
jgi:predicted transposase/invertase (TIGR01784 family)